MKKIDMYESFDIAERESVRGGGGGGGGRSCGQRKQ